VVEGAVDHTISLRRAAAQTFQVLKIAAMHLGTGGGERLGPRVRPRQSENLMAGIDELRDDGGADKAGRAGEEYAHGKPPLLCGD